MRCPGSRVSCDRGPRDPPAPLADRIVVPVTNPVPPWPGDQATARSAGPDAASLPTPPRRPPDQREAVAQPYRPQQGPQQSSRPGSWQAAPARYVAPNTGQQPQWAPAAQPSTGGRPQPHPKVASGLGVAAVAVLVSLCSTFLGAPPTRAVSNAATSFLGDDGDRTMLVQVGGPDSLEVAWARNDSAAILGSGPEAFGHWVNIAAVGVSSTSYARLTTIRTAPSGLSRADRLLTLATDGVRANVVQTAGEAGLAYVPGKLVLPADLAPGRRWSSNGNVRAFASERFAEPVPYTSEAAAEPATDPDQAARGCLDVAETERTGERSVRTVTTWCPGIGIVAWSDDKVEFRQGDVARAGQMAPDSFDWDTADRLIWQTSQVSRAGLSLVSQSPAAPPGVLADGTLVYANRTGRDVVAIRPGQAEPSVWRARPGGDITTAASIGGITVVVTSLRVASAFDSDGRWLWSTPVPDIARLPPQRFSAGIVVATIDGTVSLLDPADGASLWTHKTKGELGVAPVVLADALVVADQSGDLARLDPDGNVVWTTSGSKPDQVAVAGEVVTVSPHAGSVVSAFKLEDGSPIWHFRPEAAFDQLLGFDSVLVARTNDEIRGYVPDTGKLVWRVSLVSQDIVGADRRMLVVAEHDVVILDPVSGAELDRQPHGLGAASARTVLVSSGPGHLVVSTADSAAVGSQR